MPIKRISPPNGPDKAMKKLQGDIVGKIIKTLAYIGETCVKYAREKGSYQDQTGNLRSSIGYAILVDGKKVSVAGFEEVKTGNMGIETGIYFLNELAKQFNRGIVLIVVAGMDYAAAVESRGYDVLTGSELTAKKMVPVLLNKLGFAA